MGWFAVSVALGTAPYFGMSGALDQTVDSTGASVVCKTWNYAGGTRVVSASATAISATATNDAWAVGYRINKEDYFMEHWDGSEWTETPHPDVRGAMIGAVAITPDDTWAVGRDSALPNPNALIEHWDGTVWSVVPSPGTDAYLGAVDAVASDDVWAVGSGGLIEHWDGTAWTIVPGDPDPSVQLLQGVAAISADDLWAVGSQASPTGVLIEHWDGVTWTEVEPETPPPGINVLFAISPVSPDDVWTVGATGSSPLIEHWNGVAWSIVPSPEVPGSLRGVVGLSSTDAWAVGGLTTDAEYPLVEHWDGVSWKRATPAQPIRDGSVLFAAGATAARDVWTVGVQTRPQTQLPVPLIEHSKGLCP